MKEVIITGGWIIGVQGALGPLGRIFGDEPWGLLHKWWDVPTPLYIALFAVGAALVVYGETSKKRAAARG